MLKKNLQNRDLALVLFNKLFAELPEQILAIENHLKLKQLSQAQEIVHKLHGSVSFCGFTELQKLAYDLETSLQTQDLSNSKQHFLPLKQHLTQLQNLQSAIINYFEN